MGFRETAINAVLVGLVILAFIAFAAQTASDNNPNRTIISNPSINQTYSSLSTTLNGAAGIAGGQLNATSSETPTLGFGSLVLFSIVGAGRVFTGLVTGIYQIIFVLMVQQLQIPVILINVLITIILISVIFLGWRLYRIGS